MDMKKVKENKIIIIGFGSIGKRHYRNLLSLGFKNIFVYDTDKRQFDGYEGVDRINDINAVCPKQFDVAFICNPNNMHMKTAILCAKAGCHLFIEKPLSHNLTGLGELLEICRKKKLFNMVACNIRFHPGLRFVKNYLEKNKLGKVYNIDVQFGQYLPFWRPKQDYRKNYAAKRKTGGGIILDDVHSFDLLFWLNDFSGVQESKFIFGRVGGLEIETEDMCVASFKFGNKSIGSVRVDYLQKYYVWSCKVIGAKGNLEWNFKDNRVCLYDENGIRKLHEAKDYDLNGMYIDEVKYFFDCLNKKRKCFNDIKRAAGVLKFCVERI